MSPFRHRAVRGRLPLRVERLESRDLPSVMTLYPDANVSALGGQQYQGTIAIDLYDPARLFTAANQDGGGLFAATSADGGASWTPNDLAGLPAPAGEAQALFDGLGNLFLTYVGAKAEVVVAWSTDAGQTFAGAAVVGSTLSRPRLAVGPGGDAAAGSVWVAYADGTGSVAVTGAPVYGLGDLGGFTESVALPFFNPSDFPGIAVGPAGQVMVSVVEPGNPGEASYSLHRDPDGFGPEPFGTRFTSGVINVGVDRTLPAQPNRPISPEVQIAWDTTGGRRHGRVYILYTDAPSSASDDTNIVLRYSDNEGSTFVAPIRVNNDTTGRSQFNPSLALDRWTGKLAVAWYDARYDRGDFGANDTDGVPNTDVRVFATFSYDGGRTFLPNRAVSSGVSNASYAGNPADLGGSLGIDMAANSFWVAWSDNNPFLEPLNPEYPAFDLAAARVDVPANLVTYEHADLAANYDGQQWLLDVHDKGTPTRWTPDQGILYVHLAARTTQPAGFDFIGAGTGNPVWILPQAQAANLLFLGWNAEGTPLGALEYYLETDPRVGIEGDWIRITVRDVRGPGHFSVWQTGAFTTTVWMSTFEGGITDGDAFFQLVQGHSHANFAFTEPGIYEIDFQASAFLPGMIPTQSDIVTFIFCVEAPDPEEGDGPGLPTPEAFPHAPVPVNALLWVAPTPGPAVVFFRAPPPAPRGGMAPVDQVFAVTPDKRPLAEAAGREVVRTPEGLFADVLQASLSEFLG